MWTKTFFSPRAPLPCATSLLRTCPLRAAVTLLGTKKGHHHAAPNIRGLPSHQSRAPVQPLNPVARTTWPARESSTARSPSPAQNQIPCSAAFVATRPKDAVGLPPLCHPSTSRVHVHTDVHRRTATRRSRSPAVTRVAGGKGAPPRTSPSANRGPQTAGAHQAVLERAAAGWQPR